MNGIPLPIRRILVPSLQRPHCKRFAISFPVVYRPLCSQRGRAPQYMPAELEAISLNGCRFRANQALKPGTSVKIRLSLFEILRRDGAIPFDTAADAFDLVATAELRSRMSRLDGEYVYESQFAAFHQGDLAIFAAAIDHLGRRSDWR